MKKQTTLIKKKLFQLFQSNKQNPIQKNNNLIEICSDLNLIKYVYSKLKYKQQNISVKANMIDKIDLKILKQLNKQIQTGDYI